MNAVGYIRVSTEEQAREGFSLGSQTGKIQAYCTLKDWRLMRLYVDDGFTGKDDDRPEYQRMMAAMSTWDGVIVIKLDRIHRNLRNFLAMTDTFRAKGKEFVSIYESLDTSTAVGRFVVVIFAALAQLESEQIGERTSWGMAQAKKEGVHVGRPPIGFTIAKDGKSFEPTLEAKQMFDTLTAFGMAEAVRQLKINRYVLYRLKRNFELYAAGKLTPGFSQ